MAAPRRPAVKPVDSGEGEAQIAQPRPQPVWLTVAVSALPLTIIGSSLLNGSPWQYLLSSFLQLVLAAILPAAILAAIFRARALAYASRCRSGLDACRSPAQRGNRADLDRSNRPADLFTRLPQDDPLRRKPGANSSNFIPGHPYLPYPRRARW